MNAPRSPLLSAILAALLLAQPLLAFQTPLSDESVREAYFLGQRHDGSLERLLEKATAHLPEPQTGPYVSSIQLITPFLDAVLFSSTHVGNYSAQQAALDHRAAGSEIMRIVVEIQLTDSYGQFMNVPPTNDPAALIRRSGDFWTDFSFRVYDGERTLLASATRGHGNYRCGDDYGTCVLTGATVELDFPADTVASDEITVTVNPPESQMVKAGFDVTSFR